MNFGFHRVLLHATNPQFSSNPSEMSDEITNVGKKGYCLMWGIIGFLLFLVLVLYIYFYNGKFLP